MNLSSSWYKKAAPIFTAKKSKSILHDFFVYGKEGLTINPYNGCHHRCGYCYATYEWSSEFYDHIYAKINATDLLSQQIQSCKGNIIHPVMIASATDAYQPAELKYSLTRKCVEVLQEFEIPYYIFTKSSLIERDLELHTRYSHNCFVVWSITTNNENIKRIVEPGTPPSKSVYKVIEKFCKSGIKCVVNIDPILPLITDSKEDIANIIDSANDIGVKYVSGAILRLRYDIWERMKYILHILNIDNSINFYEKIFKFKDPINFKKNLNAEREYTESIMMFLENELEKRNIKFGYPKLNIKKLTPSSAYSLKNKKNIVSLMDFME
ncbi:MAG: radical SAM protein [Nitrososphaeraceae archaeon]|jgi:DNA repair photolyase|nr:radical SAM protein [Nitrososphaeraceae archaeon]MDW3611653.1 radical SAM protein [Nitrososphaeraceae archaeon]